MVIREQERITGFGKGGKGKLSPRSFSFSREKLEDIAEEKSKKVSDRKVETKKREPDQKEPDRRSKFQRLSDEATHRLMEKAKQQNAHRESMRKIGEGIIKRTEEKERKIDEESRKLAKGESWQDMMDRKYWEEKQKEEQAVKEEPSATATPEPVPEPKKQEGGVPTVPSIPTQPIPSRETPSVASEVPPIRKPEESVNISSASDMAKEAKRLALDAIKKAEEATSYPGHTPLSQMATVFTIGLGADSSLTDASHSHSIERYANTDGNESFTLYGINNKTLLSSPLTGKHFVMADDKDVKYAAWSTIETSMYGAGYFYTYYGGHAEFYPHPHSQHTDFSTDDHNVASTVPYILANTNGTATRNACHANMKIGDSSTAASIWPNSRILVAPDGATTVLCWNTGGTWELTFGSTNKWTAATFLTDVTGAINLLAGDTSILDINGNLTFQPRTNGTNYLGFGGSLKQFLGIYWGDGKLGKTINNWSRDGGLTGTDIVSKRIRTVDADSGLEVDIEVLARVI